MERSRDISGAIAGRMNMYGFRSSEGKSTLGPFSFYFQVDKDTINNVVNPIATYASEALDFILTRGKVSWYSAILPIATEIGKALTDKNGPVGKAIRSAEKDMTDIKYLSLEYGTAAALAPWTGGASFGVAGLSTLGRGVYSFGANLYNNLNDMGYFSKDYSLFEPQSYFQQLPVNADQLADYSEVPPVSLDTELG